MNEETIKAKIDDNSLFEQEQGISTNFDEQIKNFYLKIQNLVEYVNTH